LRAAERFLKARGKDHCEGAPDAACRLSQDPSSAGKVEHRNPVKDMTDEELEAAIEFIEKMLAAQAEKAKVIDGAAEPTTLAFPTEFEQPQRKRSNRLLEHVDTAIGPTRKSQ